MKLFNKLVLLGVATLLASCEIKPPPPPEAPPPPAKPLGNLFDAARQGDVALASVLAAQGADINATDSERMTAMHHAALTGQALFIQWLVIRGAKFDERDQYGFTPLHTAARDGYLEAVKALVTAGADVNAEDSEGMSPVAVARFMQKQEVVDYLYAHGARRDVPPVESNVVVTVEAPPLAIVLTGVNFRVWTSASGAQIEAEFVQCVMDVVTLRKRDASLVRIRLNLLKPVDQVAARQMSGTVLPVLTRQRAARPERDLSKRSIGERIGEEKGWTVLENCRLLHNGANDGDSFHVMGGGKEYIFRLYYVDAAETSMAYPDRVSEQGKYFRLDDQETLRLGEEAKKFTDKILSSGDFTIVTKWEDARGNSRLPRQYAFVSTSQGDLDELLMAEGLVRLYGMRIDGAFGSKKYSELQSLERDAKRDKAGAWGLGKDDVAAAKRP